MITKVLAAKRAARSGASTVIAWGREPDVLLRLAAGEAIGTALRRDDAEARRAQAVDEPTTCSCAARSSSTTAPPRSCATAARACCRSASSSVAGRVPSRRRHRRARAPAARRSRRGLANYGSTEARLIARKPSREIERLLGFTGEPELIHRDNLVLA